MDGALLRIVKSCSSFVSPSPFSSELSSSLWGPVGTAPENQARVALPTLTTPERGQCRMRANRLIRIPSSGFKYRPMIPVRGNLTFLVPGSFSIA